MSGKSFCRNCRAPIDPEKELCAACWDLYKFTKALEERCAERQGQAASRPPSENQGRADHGMDTGKEA